MKLSADPYATGVLKPHVHARLVAGITTYARNANITPERIWTSILSTDASRDEIEYVHEFRCQTSNGKYGLVFTGKDPQRNISDAMANLAGAMVRNFTRARFMTVEEVLYQMPKHDHGFTDYTCLLIPDFHIELPTSEGIAEGRISKLRSLLINRQTRGLQTVLYVSDMADLKLEYGSMIGRHIEKSFHLVDVG